MERIIIYISIGAIFILVLVASLFLQHQNLVPAPAVNTQEAVDISLGQYTEQPNAVPTQNDTVAAAAMAATPRVQGCSLHFAFAPTAKVVAPGGVVNYNIKLVNQGSETCKNASFSIYYSDDETYISAAPHPTASNYYWSVGDLVSGKTYTVTLSTRENGGGTMAQFNNESCATADNSKDVCASNTIFVQIGAAAAPAAVTSISNPTASPVASGIWGAMFQKREFATWIWDSPVQMAPGYASAALTAAQQNGFNLIYLTIDDYLSIAVLPDSAEKQDETNAYMSTLNAFISMAQQKGIAVDVEGGASDWAESANRWKGYDLIDFVASYNQKYPLAKIHGLQYDVESYLLPQYNTDQVSVLSDYIAFIDESANRMESVDAQFSVVIPHFYDSEIQWTPDISYNGKTAYTLTHLLDVLQQKPGSELVVMAYRNFFTGDNGTEQISQAEIQEAATNGYSTKIIVAQETGDVAPSYVTFYGLSKDDLFQALSDITAAYQSYPSFGGVAVHYLDPFLALK